MPADFDKCVNGGGKVRTMRLKDGKYMHVCYDKSGKSHAGEVKSKQESISWTSSILTEDFKENDNILNDVVKIRGTAIKARESRNGIVYEMVELAKSKDTLLNKTIALNHSENAEDVVGIIDEVFDTGDGLEYSGRAYNTGKHPYVIELLRKGLMRHVSIEATTPQIEESEGKKIARNLEFLGLAFVRHPGIPEASASIIEALDLIEADGKAKKKASDDDEDAEDSEDNEDEDEDDMDKKMKKKKMMMKKKEDVVEITAEGDLTSAARDDLPTSDFAIPSERRYPIHDISHARNALARVSQYGSSEEKKKVKAAVHKKYPELAKDDKEAISILLLTEFVNQLNFMKDEITKLQLDVHEISSRNRVLRDSCKN